ncbi:MAG: hypothetical protein IKU11_10930 [Clostridia bacterium]|nr:hypothetical protein [Clostridia bacterium]
MKIEILYPEICNLYGDLFNPDYLARSIHAEVIHTGLKDTPRFVSEKIDLVYMGTTTERGQELVRDALKPHLDAIRTRIAQGGVTLITGNAMEIFGEYIANEDGTRVEMLGLFPIHATRKMMSRYNSLYLGELGGFKIIGFKSQFGHAYGQNGQGLFHTIRGAGLNPDVMEEGLRDGNFMATYVIGPVVVMNPPFAKYVLELMGVENPTLAFEEVATDMYNTRLSEFSEPDRGFIYH